MIGRALIALLIGVVVFLVALLVIFVINKMLPGVGLDPFWAGLIGALAGLIAFFGGHSRLIG